MVSNIHPDDNDAEIIFYANENKKLRRLIYFMKKGMAFSYLKGDDFELIYTINALDDLCERQKRNNEKEKAK